MAKFIRLTQVYKDNGTEVPLFVNIEHISMVRPSTVEEQNIQSRVTVRGRIYTVKEPFSVVVDLLKTPSGP